MTSSSHKGRDVVVELLGTGSDPAGQFCCSNSCRECNVKVSAMKSFFDETYTLSATLRIYSPALCCCLTPLSRFSGAYFATSDNLGPETTTSARHTSPQQHLYSHAPNLHLALFKKSLQRMHNIIVHRAVFAALGNLRGPGGCVDLGLASVLTARR
jgi:hypothetical protein